MTATTQLWNSGTSNNGIFGGSTVTLMADADTGFDSLTNASVVVSSSSGTSGVFSQVNTSSAVWGTMRLTLGAIALTVGTGGAIFGWFLETNDGSTYESTTVAPTRPADFVFALPPSTVAAGAVFDVQGRLVRLPSQKFKVMLQNNLGQTLAASGNSVVLSPLAVIEQ